MNVSDLDLKNYKVIDCEFHGEVKSFSGDKKCFHCEIENDKKRIYKEIKESKYLSVGLPKQFDIKESANNKSLTERLDILGNRIFLDIKNKGNFIFTGTTGTGKTWASCYIACKLSEMMRIKFISSLEINRYCFDFDKKDEIYPKILHSDLVIIDDLGRDDNKLITKFYQDLVYFIHENSIKTIYTTNLSSKMLREYLGERCSDRMLEDSTIISFAEKLRRGAR